MPAPTAPFPLDVGRLLDEGRSGGYQQALIALTALTIIFDGADIQLLGFAIPSMMRDWNVARPAFAPVLAASLAGMMVGGALSGLAGDRIGRKAALAASVAGFGVFTLAVAAVEGLFALAVLRFLAGVGLGGAIPNAAALASEFVPKRHRPFAVTLTIVCVPIGGTLAGLLAARILPDFGWRALFVIGGAAPLLVAAALLVLLPESPRYLVRRPERWPQLARLLRRMGHDVAEKSVFTDPSDPSRAGSPMASLLQRDLARDTGALWGAFSFCLLAVYLAFNWVPATLTGTGLDVATASRGLAAFNFGGIGGAIAGALLTTRLGSKVTLAALAVAAVLGSLVIAAMPIGASASAVPVIAMLAVIGALINGVQVGLYALATHIYPTTLRATGVGTAVSVGRLGAIASTYLGAWVLDAGGPPLFFATISATMIAAMLSLLIIRAHVPGASAPSAPSR